MPGSDLHRLGVGQSVRRHYCFHNFSPERDRRNNIVCLASAYAIFVIDLKLGKTSYIPTEGQVTSMDFVTVADSDFLLAFQLPKYRREPAKYVQFYHSQLTLGVGRRGL